MHRALRDIQHDAIGQCPRFPTRIRFGVKHGEEAPGESGPEVVEHDEEDRLAIAEEDAGIVRPAEEAQDPLLAQLLRPTRRFDPTCPTVFETFI